jgi:uncharacterized repeat protein (TIGR03803 family)
MVALLASALAHASTYELLYSFRCGTDGAYPFAGLAIDSLNNLYGTTSRGGAYGQGTVFKVSSSGTETVLYSFPGFPTDGYYPASDLVRDSAGDLYGTTSYGGQFGGGTVFEISAAGVESILYSFSGGTDGGNPNGLVLSSSGNLFGTTYSGGAHGFGTVFELLPVGTETVLHSFANSTADGSYPFAGLVMDSAGDLYGTTNTGGALGLGTLFDISAAGSYTVLHSFTGSPLDGANPAARLFLNAQGNLYGTTSFGGAENKGIVFEWSSAGVETVTHSFTGSVLDGGAQPGGLVGDDSGNLYGTTLIGGTMGCANSGCGLIFDLAPNGSESVLHYFGSPPADGHFSYGSPIQDTAGNLYGTTYIAGRFQCGTVFKVAP